MELWSFAATIRRHTKGFWKHVFGTGFVTNMTFSVLRFVTNMAFSTL